MDDKFEKHNIPGLCWSIEILTSNKNGNLHEVGKKQKETKFFYKFKFKMKMK